MDTTEIIQGIDAEIARLEEVKALLNGGTNTPVKRGSKPVKATSSAFGSNATKATTSKRRWAMSAEGRARIAAAQKARWAKTRRDK
jgi:hypothetical protein